MSKFLNDCQEAISKITEEDILAFNSAKDPESRIKILHKYANNIPVNKEGSKKNLKSAETEKARGNSYFAKKDYKNAIKSYNIGIINCPQDTDSAKELLAVLVANRSATFFEMEEYRKVLNDIDYIMEIDKYPKHLCYKVWLRKAKCYDALKNVRSANEAYNQAFDYIKHSGLDEKTIAGKIEEINKYREKIKEKPVSLELVTSTYGEELFVQCETYVAASEKVSFEQDLVQGRYARAREYIPAGHLIVQENSHCSVLLPENVTSNCQHCLLATNQIFACPGCSTAAFCSSNCQRIASRTYHKYECCFQESLIKIEASVNCLLALRIITQKNLKFFTDRQRILRDFLRDNCKKAFKKISPYRADDYNTVFFLCRNEFSRNKEELLHYSIMALYLLKLLKTSDYFQKNSCDGETLTDEEAFVTALMLRHLELLQFNCHEIAELRNTKETDMDESSTSYKLDFIGAALYPTASLFNHSCDPSILRYNIGNKLIVRTIKPIKEGEIIYENYGPLYTTMKREFRQQFLTRRYWFDCLCIPCTDYWPLLENMDENEIRMSCVKQKCPYVFVINKRDTNPFLICEYCGNETSLFPILKNLMQLQTLLPQAEHFYGKGQYQEAIKFYLEALEIIFKHLRAPCPDMVKIQQRLRTCFVHYGNRSLDYIATNSD